MKRSCPSAVKSVSGIHRHLARGAVDLADDVLHHRRPGPQELAGLPVQRVDDPGLARDAGHHSPALARLQLRVDPGDLLRVGRNGRIHQKALEGVVQIPVIDHVLVVPHDLAGVGVQGQRGVVVQVLLVVAAEHVLRRRRRHRRADVDHVELWVVARHHPGADVHALLERHVPPRLVARLSGTRHRARAPDLLAGLGVVGGDHAGVGPAFGFAPASGDHLAVGDDRAEVCCEPFW